MEEENGQSSNRLFVLVAVALIGLICIGLLGLSGVLFFTQANRAQQEVVAVQPEVPTSPPPTFTPTPTDTATPTITPEPTPTSTPVVAPDADSAAQTDVQPETEDTTGQPPDDTGAEQPGAQVEGTATSTVVVATPVATAVVPTVTPAMVPSSGGVLSTDNGFLLWAGGSFLLILLLYSLFWHSRASSKIAE